MKTISRILPLAPACAALLFLTAAAYGAGTPLKISFQGRLDENSQPASGSKTFIFTIHDAASGGSVVWTGGAQAVTVENGVFNAILSDGTPALSTAVFAGARYVAVNVNGTDLAPRQEMVSAPYALVAQTLAPDAVFSLSTASITSGKFGDDRVAITTAAFPGGFNAADQLVRLDPLGRLGVSTGVVNSALTVGGPVSLPFKVVTASPYAIQPEDSTILVDNTANINPFQVVLPPAAGAAGRIYTIKVIAPGDAVAIALVCSDYMGAMQETIDGAQEIDMSGEWTYKTVQSLGEIVMPGETDPYGAWTVLGTN